MKQDIITKHKLSTTYNDKKEKILVDEWETKHRGVRIKNGWFRMYDEGLDSFLVCKSNVEIKMMLFIIRSVNKNLTLILPTAKLAKTFEVSKVKATDFINRLKKSDFLLGSRGIFLVNPNQYLPKNTSNEIAKEFQDKWVEAKESENE